MQSRILFVKIGDVEPKPKLFIISNKYPLYNQNKRLSLRLKKSVQLYTLQNKPFVSYEFTKFDEDKDYRDVKVEY